MSYAGKIELRRGFSDSDVLKALTDNAHLTSSRGMIVGADRAFIHIYYLDDTKAILLLEQQ